MGWARWLVDHAVTVVIMVGTILVFGVSAYLTLPRESTPDIKIPVIIVSTPYFGVSPGDIESLVTIPMERKLKDLRDVDKMSSSSMEGASIVTLEFSPDVDIEDALQKVREKVDAAQTDIPEDAEDSSVSEISFSDFPILIVGVTGTQDEQELKRLAEGLEDQIEAIPGILDVTVSGGLTREVRVLVQPERMSLYDVSFNDIIRGIQAENVNIPGGNVDARESDYLLRVPGEFAQVADIEQVPVKNVGGRTVFVRDVARVVDGYAERATLSRMNGTPSLSLGVKKRVGENIVDLAAATRELVADNASGWPEGTSTAILADQSRNIENSVSELENNILSGLILVVLVLLFFMGFRNSWFVGLAIPLSMFVSFMVIQSMGITLNMIVLFALILALGMLVDNAIVVVENIYRHHEEGKDLREASIIGVSEVALPVATSTLTTVLAFAPLLFWEGIMGEFMGYLPRTLIIVLVSSLFVAFVVIPVATSRLMKRVDSEVQREEGELPPENTLMGKVMKTYKRGLEWSIDHRYLSAFAGAATLFGTIAVYGVMNHGTEFFPSTEPNQVQVAIVAPDGTRLETTDRFARQMEAMIALEEDVDTYVTEVGVTAGGGGFTLGGSVPHSAKISIDYKPTKGNAREGEPYRTGSSFDSIERLRVAAGQVVGANVTVDPAEMGPPVGLPIEVQISGDDFHELGKHSQEFQRQLRALQGVVDIQDDYRVGRPELRFDVDRGAAKKVGASTSAVANTIRTAVAGSKASVLRDGEDEYDIVVELEPQYKDDVSAIMNLRVPGKDNFMVPLSTLASYETRGGSGAVKHLDRDKVITVTADVEGVNVNVAQQSVQALIDDWKLPEGYQARMGGADEQQKEAGAFLMRAFFLAVAMIFLVLVTQFDSVSRPFIIMASVVLSLVGVLWGLLLTGTPFGIMMTGIGVISLAGVVVNNAIVLLDYVQLLRDRGMDVRDALVRAGLVRFRPVILTAITTILGLIPMATGLSVDFRRMRLIVGGESAAFWGPMAIAVCFGLAVATVLTLVMVPTMYSINEDLNGMFKRVFGKKPVDMDVTQTGLPVPALSKSAPIVGGLLLLGAALFAQPAFAVSLDEAIAAAEKNNLDLKLVSEQTHQTQIQVGQAWALLSPKVSATANYTINDQEAALDFSEFGGGMEIDPDSIDFSVVEPENAGAVGDTLEVLEQVFAGSSVTPEPTIITEKQYADANFSIVQPLVNVSSIPLLRGAYMQRNAAHYNEAATRGSVKVAVAQVYYGLVVAREGVGISERSLANAQKHFQLTQRQVDAGASAELAVLQAELSASRAERELRSARERLVSAEQSFASMTGLPASSPVSMPPQLSMTSGTVDDAVEFAFERRPDLAAAQLNSQVARMQLKADQLEWVPDVNGRFTGIWTQNAGFAGRNTQWMVVLSADWTLWDGGFRLASNRTNASAARMASLSEEKTRLEVEQEVREAWAAFHRADMAYQAVTREIKLAQTSLQLAERGLEAGSNTWLEAEDARLGLQGAELALASERMNRDVAVLHLKLAMGDDR